MGEFALYKALHSYTPSPTDEAALTFQRDDVFEISVQSPCFDSDADPKAKKGWLYAYNRCTGAEGYVKGMFLTIDVSCALVANSAVSLTVEHVKLLGSEVNNTIHHPSAPGLEGGFHLSPYNGSPGIVTYINNT